MTLGDDRPVRIGILWRGDRAAGVAHSATGSTTRSSL